MKLALVFSILLFSVLPCISQNHDNISVQFKEAKNDSMFVYKNSIAEYKIYTVDTSHTSKFSNVADSIIYNSVLGEVVGPFETGTSVYYLKNVRVDSAFYLRVGNIWLDVDRGREACSSLAFQIQLKIEAGEDFNTLCLLYSDDENKNRDCDIGWFYNTSMAEPFASEVVKHHLGEIFAVNTKFGSHVVKILEEPVMKLKAVSYVVLEIAPPSLKE